MKRVPRLVGEPVGAAADARGRHVAVHGLGDRPRRASPILFSFNDGRSRSVWQGFSTRWYWGDPDQSVLHDPALRGALEQSLKLAGLDMLIAVPLGVGLAIGLTRWRGFGARPVNFLMLFPLVTPEIVMAVSLLLVFVSLYKIQLGTTAQALGQVTFSISYVVLVVRGRLLSVGPPVRGGGARPRRVDVRRAAARAAAAARAGDLREPDGGVRALDRRLRRHRLPVVELVDADGADQDLLERPRDDDAGAERARDGDGARDARRGRARGARLPAVQHARNRREGQRGERARGAGDV